MPAAEPLEGPLGTSNRGIFRLSRVSIEEDRDGASDATLPTQRPTARRPRSVALCGRGYRSMGRRAAGSGPAVTRISLLPSACPDRHPTPVCANPIGRRLAWLRDGKPGPGRHAAIATVPAAKEIPPTSVLLNVSPCGRRDGSQHESGVRVAGNRIIRRQKGASSCLRPSGIFFPGFFR